MNMNTYDSATPTLLSTDLLGSPLRKINAGRQALSYTPFGHEVVSQIASFTGQVKEPASDLYLLGNGYRPYSTSLMRFTAADELSPLARGGLNSYAYCANQPVTQTDPDGRFSKLLVAALGFTGAGVGALITGSVLHESDETGLSKGLMIAGAALSLAGLGGVGYRVARSYPRSPLPRIRELQRLPVDNRAVARNYQLASSRRANMFSPSRQTRHTDQLRLDRRAQEQHRRLANRPLPAIPEESRFSYRT